MKKKADILYINGRFLTQKVTGVQRYAIEVVKRIDKQCKKDSTVLLCPNNIINDIELKNIQIKKIGKLKGQMWEQFSLPLYIMHKKGKLLNLCNLGPILYPGYTVIHDIGYKTHNEHLNWKFIFWYKFVTRMNIRRYKHVFTVSEFSKKEILDNYKIDEKNITVTYNSAEHFKDRKADYSVLKKNKLEGIDFYFSVGRKSPHKNHKFIEELAERNPDKIFVVTGNKNNRIFKDDEEKNIKNLIYTGYLEDGELKALYEHCKAFILPSLYEGFGIPPLEAMECGCKNVFVSDIPSLKEIYGDSVNYIELGSDNQYQLIDKEHDTKEILEKYSWTKVANMIMDIVSKKKVLIINDSIISGGAEVYSLNLKKILENKYNVSLLTFDKNFEDKIKTIDNKKNIYNINPKSILGKANKLILNPVLYKRIRTKLREINPDLVILNNIFLSPITQIKALKGFDIYQVVHDYSIICPKTSCIKEDGSICNGYKESHCVKECKYHASKKSTFFKLHLTKKMEKLRKKRVKKLIIPSQKLCDYANKYGYDCVCINNPIIMDNIQNQHEPKDNNEYKKFLYVGIITENKGIFPFVESFKSFAQNKNVSLDIIGGMANEECRMKIEKLTKEDDKINLLGFKPNNEINKYMTEADYVVVPSLSMENYPTTVLEAMLSKTLIIGSNRGGIPEMLDNGRGIVFDIMNPKDIIDKLQNAYDIDLKDYIRITNEAYEYVKNNNSFELYKNNFIKLIEEE